MNMNNLFTLAVAGVLRLGPSAAPNLQWLLLGNLLLFILGHLRLLVQGVLGNGLLQETLPKSSSSPEEVQHSQVEE